MAPFQYIIFLYRDQITWCYFPLRKYGVAFLPIDNAHHAHIFWHMRALIRTWISNRVPLKMWDETTYLFPNFSGTTVEVWQAISNFISHFIMDVIIYPCWGLSKNGVSKWGPRQRRRKCYGQISNMSLSLVGNKIVDHSDVAGAACRCCSS